MNRGVIACAIASIVLTGPLAGDPDMAGTQETSVTGRISPASEVSSVQIVNPKDSIKATWISGNFFARVKPGKYKLIINTTSKNRLVQVDNVQVIKNQALDIGEIILQ